MIGKIINILGILLLCPKSEQIAFSNLFNNKVKREVRREYSYKKDYWMVIR